MPWKSKNKTKSKFSKTKKSKMPLMIQKPKQVRGPFRAITGFDPFPIKYSCKLRYSETIALASGTVGLFGDENRFILNGLYDPNYTGTGHQPYGYDQVAALYRRYIVKGVNIELVYNNPSADGLVVAAMIQSSGGIGVLTGQTPDIIKEQPYSVTRPLNNTGSQYTRINQYIDLAKLEGLNRIQWQSNLDQYGALVNANPLLQPNLRIAAGCDTATSGITCVCRVVITYYVQFFDRILQPYS